MKTYIKPAIAIQAIIVEQLLASESGDIKYGLSKENDSAWTDDDDVEASSYNEPWQLEKIFLLEPEQLSLLRFFMLVKFRMPSAC